ncbi:MAG TPA: hypothetical protein VF575_05785 [Candidatus Saccharimonadales bacterium]|jgi:hypothetical protein
MTEKTPSFHEKPENVWGESTTMEFFDTYTDRHHQAGTLLSWARALQDEYPQTAVPKDDGPYDRVNIEEASQRIFDPAIVLGVQELGSSLVPPAGSTREPAVDDRDYGIVGLSARTGRTFDETGCYVMTLDGSHGIVDRYPEFSGEQIELIHEQLAGQLARGINLRNT